MQVHAWSLSPISIYLALFVSAGVAEAIAGHHNTLHFLGVTYNRSSGHNVLLSIDPVSVSVSSATEFDFDSGGWSTHLAGVIGTGQAYARSSAGTLYEFYIDSVTGTVRPIGKAYFGDVLASAADFDIHAVMMGAEDTGYGDLVGIGYNRSSLMHGITSMRSSTGNLTRITNFNFNTGGWAPSTFAVNQTSGQAYAISKNGTLYQFTVSVANVWEVIEVGGFGASAPIFMSMDIGPSGTLLAVGYDSSSKSNVFMAIDPATPAIINSIAFSYSSGTWSTDTFCADQTTGIAYSATTIKSGTEAELYKFQATIGSDGGGGLTAALSVNSLGDLLISLTSSLSASLHAMTVTYVAPPTVSPTISPTTGPTSSAPTSSPTSSTPTLAPSTPYPTTSPSQSPSTSRPTRSPSFAPTSSPTTSAPTNSPTTSLPSYSPTSSPSFSPSSSAPTRFPSMSPTLSPSSSQPTRYPSTSLPTIIPTTSTPTFAPTESPSLSPTTSLPTAAPVTSVPTTSPSTNTPTVSPSLSPSTSPSTTSPTTSLPTLSPTTSLPTRVPTTSLPTESPVTSMPTRIPTLSPSTAPTTALPTESPLTSIPSSSPSTSIPTTILPTILPSTSTPTSPPVTSIPTSVPSVVNLMRSTNSPSAAPSTWASNNPTLIVFTVPIVDLNETEQVDLVDGAVQDLVSRFNGTLNASDLEVDIGTNGTGFVVLTFTYPPSVSVNQEQINQVEEDITETPIEISIDGRLVFGSPPTAPSGDADGEDGDFFSIGVIAGIAIGVIVLFLIVIFVVKRYASRTRDGNRVTPRSSVSRPSNAELQAEENVRQEIWSHYHPPGAPSVSPVESPPRSPRFSMTKI